ncbi:hypothetical protein ACFL6C_09765 [Myxococcota bacterium]
MSGICTSTCYGNCADLPCVAACQAQYPTGSALWYDYINCLYYATDTCSVDCASTCPIEPV